MRNNGGLSGLLLFLVTITAREGSGYSSEHHRELWAGSPSLNKCAIFRASAVKSTVLCAMDSYPPTESSPLFSIDTD